MEKHVRDNVVQWHRNRAVKAWLAGRWEEYTKHIRFADQLEKQK